RPHPPPPPPPPTPRRPPPAPRRAPPPPATASPSHRAVRARVRTGSRTVRRNPDRAPPPGTPPRGYRVLRTTSAGASPRHGSWAAKLPRLSEAPSTTSPQGIIGLTSTSSSTPM